MPIKVITPKKKSKTLYSRNRQIPKKYKLSFEVNRKRNLDNTITGFAYIVDIKCPECGINAMTNKVIGRQVYLNEDKYHAFDFHVVCIKCQRYNTVRVYV